MTCFLLPYAMADGPANMALDEAMLEDAARGDAAYLRFYGWTVPTLSLGYFQRLADVRSDPRWAGRSDRAAADRRRGDLAPSRADVCDRRPCRLPARPAEHGALSGRARGDRGVARWNWGSRPAAAATRPSRRDSGAERPFLCFTGRDPEDIVSEGHKLVGSAQRRRGGAVLQHGSVLLARSPGVPELLGVCDVAEIPASTEEWERQLRRAHRRRRWACRRWRSTGPTRLARRARSSGSGRPIAAPPGRRHASTLAGAATGRFSLPGGNARRPVDRRGKFG